MKTTLRNLALSIAIAVTMIACTGNRNPQESELAITILEDKRLDAVYEMAKETLTPEDGQFKAGSNYPETWIRDFATFVEVALEVNPRDVIKERILLFFDFQGEDGNIVDGYTELDTEAGYDYIFSETAPAYKAHKNTVETDQESSLILAIARYIEATGDKQILYEVKNEKQSVITNVKKYLWDEENQKIIPHVYLEDSPFSGFNEDEIFYLGGTVYAILAGILNENEIEASFNKMIEIKEISGSMTIAIINYPPYPEGSFYEGRGTLPYVYVNAADWTWWGGRAIEAMVKTGHLDLAYQEISPFLDRVIKNDGFYEWYSVLDHQPHGSNTFLGAAGALGKAIKLMKEEASRKSKKPLMIKEITEP